MSETFQEYRDRVLGYLGDHDPIMVQEQTPRQLRTLVSDLSHDVLLFRPRDGEWCIVEIFLHMADAELAMGWRLRNMLAAPGGQLSWFDENKWPQALDYSRKDIRQALDLLTSLRRGNLELLRFVPRDKWDSYYGVHSVRGRQTVYEFVRLEAAHDLSHLRQIEQVLAANRES